MKKLTNHAYTIWNLQSSHTTQYLILVSEVLTVKELKIMDFCHVYKVL